VVPGGPGVAADPVTIPLFPGLDSPATAVTSRISRALPKGAVNWVLPLLIVTHLALGAAGILLGARYPERVAGWIVRMISTRRPAVAAATQKAEPPKPSGPAATPIKK
jgi:hypothetical protein